VVHDVADEDVFNYLIRYGGERNRSIIGWLGLTALLEHMHYVGDAPIIRDVSSVQCRLEDEGEGWGDFL
jgi:hypothetical protein